MKAYKTYLDFSFCVLALIPFRCVSAQACSSSTPFSVNATGAHTLTNPFGPPTGPLSNRSTDWIWNISTETYPAAPPTFSIRQTLRLDISPPQDFLSPDLGYLGCGLIARGLKQSVTQQGQNDDGTCGSVLSPKCIAALLNDTATFAPLLSNSEAVSIQKICAEFATQQGWTGQGVPSDCSDAFGDQAWVETFPFASPQLASEPCFNEPSVGQNASQPLYSWGSSTYSATNMTAYDNLTTSVAPLISVLFANHTTDFNSTLGYAQSRLTCLRPSDVQNGSQEPTGVPTSDARKGRGQRIWLLLVVMGLMNVFRASF